MQARQSFIRFFTDVDLVDVSFLRDGNRIIEFSVNYRAFLAGAWREVVRYDNAHGRPLHIHRFWPPQDGTKDFLDAEVRSDYTDALDEALQDLETNWQDYRRSVAATLR